jgi:hypothetical protein
MPSEDVVGPRNRDPGVAVRAAAVCSPQGRTEVVLTVGIMGGREVLEDMALMEGLHAPLGWASEAPSDSIHASHTDLVLQQYSFDLSD